MSENKVLIGAVNVTSTEVKCPGCGGTIGIKFDPESLNLCCPFCGLSSRLPQPGTGPAVREVDFNSAYQRASVNWGKVKKLIVCANCGGQTLYDAEQITGACPFCGSTSVNPAAENPQIMAPQGIIPFSVSKDMTQNIFTAYMKRKHCLAKGVVDSKLENVTGIYLPYWTFDALTVSSFKAYCYVMKVKNYYTGIWNQFFDDSIISASDRFRHPVIKKVQHFDFSGVVPYSPEYLAGIPAERYTVGLNEGWERAKTQMTEKIKRDIYRKKGLNFFFEEFNTNYYNVRFRYFLAPIYIASYRYKKKKLLVTINGQTGEIFCDAPTFIPKLVTLCLIIFFILLGLFLYKVVFPKIGLVF